MFVQIPLQFLFLFILWIFPAFSAYAIYGGSTESEYILVTGAPALLEWEKYKAQPHDKYWGNFVRATRVRMQQLRTKYGPSLQITWLVYREGYERRQQRQEKHIVSSIREIQKKYNVKLIWFHSGQQIIDYLNGTFFSEAIVQPRQLVKINGFEYFGHANRACFMFDYSNEIDGASKAYLHESQLTKIRKGIFTNRALIKSWGCNTGKSMSKKWHTATKHKMIGAIGQTDYSNGYRDGGMLPLVRGPWSR